MSIDPPDLSSGATDRGHQVCLGLGSNFEAPRRLLEALRMLGQEVEIEGVSTAWQSPAVGLESADFVNAAVLARTDLSLNDLVPRLKRIEDRLGRDRRDGPTEIAIDIDVLLFDNVVQCGEPWELSHRAVPVAELLPELCDPGSGESLGMASRRHLAALRIWPRPDIVLDAANSRTSRAGAAESS